MHLAFPFSQELRLNCSDGSVVKVGYPTAPKLYAQLTAPLGNSTAAGKASFGVEWAEAPCPGGYDRARARPHGGDVRNPVKSIQLFFRQECVCMCVCVCACLAWGASCMPCSTGTQ